MQKRPPKKTIGRKAAKAKPPIRAKARQKPYSRVPGGVEIFSPGMVVDPIVKCLNRGDKIPDGDRVFDVEVRVVVRPRNAQSDR